MPSTFTVKRAPEAECTRDGDSEVANILQAHGSPRMCKANALSTRALLRYYRGTGSPYLHPRPCVRPDTFGNLAFPRPSPNTPFRRNLCTRVRGSSLVGGRGKRARRWQEVASYWSL